jgi:transcriptional regulator with XRE-family HTH domain
MSLGIYIKTVRRRRGLSQWELSRLSGLTRSHLSRLELDNIESPSAETFISLAKALKVHPNDLYQAAGYIEENSRFRHDTGKSAEEAFIDLEQLNLLPLTVLQGSQKELTESIRNRSPAFATEEESRIIGLYARGFCLEPEVIEGDVILVDRNKKAVQESILLGYSGHKVQLFRNSLLKEDTSNDPQFYIFGVVVGINRRFN